MREIEERLAAWREEITGRGGVDRDTVRELESHLREEIDAEVADGAEPVDAFETSVARLGRSAELQAEFDKVYPEEAWSRRVLWLAAGYGFVSSCILLTVWLGVLVARYAERFFPDWTINLETSFVIERDPSHMFYADIPENGFQVTELPVGIVLGPIAQLLATVCFVVIGARILRGTSPRFGRLQSGGLPLAVFAIVTCVLSVALRTRFGSRLLYSLPGINDMDANHYYSVIQWWLNSKLYWVTWPLLIGFAFWGLLKLRRLGAWDHRAWMMSGYFLIAALAFLSRLFGLLAGLIASFCFPSMAEGYGEPWNGFVYFVSSPAAALAMAMELLTLVAIVGIAVWLVIKKRLLRADRFAARLARYSPVLVVLWSACFLFPWVAGSSVPGAVTDRLNLVSAHTMFPVGGVLALVLVGAALLARARSMRRSPASEIANDPRKDEA